MEQKQSVRIRRVGTLTFGCMLLVFGILFLIRIFVPGLDYEIIFRCWPCILIVLGIEVLAGNYKASKIIGEGCQVQFVYDKTAIFLTICITFFTMAMAVAEFCIRGAEVYGNGCIRF